MAHKRPADMPKHFRHIQRVETKRGNGGELYYDEEEMEYRLFMDEDYPAVGDQMDVGMEAAQIVANLQGVSYQQQLRAMNLTNYGK